MSANGPNLKRFFPMTAQDRLQAAARAAREGRHAEALDEFIWFHRNALAENPALSAVRRSFALGYWAELGKHYPAALRALEQIRDDSANAVLQGDGGRNAFRDVAAINEHLGTNSATYQLYLALAGSRPDVAKACAGDAVAAIVEAGDYKLARDISPPSETLIRQEAEWLNEQVQRLKHIRYTDAPRRWSHVRMFVAAVQRELTVLVGIGEYTEATRLKALALQLIPSPSLRKAVQAEFVRPSKAPTSRIERQMRRKRGS